MIIKNNIMLIAVFTGLLLAGCAPRYNPDDPDFLDPQGLGSDLPMAGRFDVTGNRVTGPEVQFGKVYFNYDSYQVSDSEKRIIEAAAEYLRKNRTHCLITEGNCDERGSREYNLSLGEHRAQAVRAYLIRLGIDGKRIQTKSYGEENPAKAGHSEGSWRLNRRVEFAVYSF